jgi:hypothetical protein
LHPIARRTSQTYHRTPRLSLRWLLHSTLPSTLHLRTRD